MCTYGCSSTEVYIRTLSCSRSAGYLPPVEAIRLFQGTLIGLKNVHAIIRCVYWMVIKYIRTREGDGLRLGNLEDVLQLCQVWNRGRAGRTAH